MIPLIKDLGHARKQQLIAHLEQFLLPPRINLIEEILAKRTRHFVVAIEDLDKERNTNAVIRTCDCFGIQELHVIDDFQNFSESEGISMGSDKWLDIHLYNEGPDNAAQCISRLRNRGFQIVATLPDQLAKPLQNFDFSQPSAFFFGSEKEGLSERILDHADQTVAIPLRGFSESLNISVSAGILLHHAMLHLDQLPERGRLSPPEIMDLKLDWMIKSIRNGDRIAALYLEQINVPG